MEKRPDRKRTLPGYLRDYELNPSKKQKLNGFEMTRNGTKIPEKVESVLIKDSVTNIKDYTFYQGKSVKINNNSKCNCFESELFYRKLLRL